MISSTYKTPCRDRACRCRNQRPLDQFLWGLTLAVCAFWAFIVRVEGFGALPAAAFGGLAVFGISLVFIWAAADRAPGEMGYGSLDYGVEEGPRVPPARAVRR